MTRFRCLPTGKSFTDKLKSSAFEFLIWTSSSEDREKGIKLLNLLFPSFHCSNCFVFELKFILSNRSQKKVRSWTLKIRIFSNCLHFDEKVLFSLPRDFFFIPTKWNTKAWMVIEIPGLCTERRKTLGTLSLNRLK